jgi:penicillin-binding protein 1C
LKQRLWQGLLALPVVLVLVVIGRALSLPSFTAFKAAQTQSYAELLDRNGQLLHRLRLDKTALREAWVPLAETSPNLLKAVLAAEDKRFASHAGVDPWAILGSLWQGLQGEPLRGASTISMQVVKPWHLSDKPLLKKAQQILDALALSLRWHKAEQLEAYVNLVPMRGEREGVAAMTQSQWQKSSSELSIAESALIAVLIRSPNAPWPQVRSRACGLLKRLQADASCEGLLALSQASRLSTAREQLAPHVAQRFLKTANQSVKVSLDKHIQQLSLSALEQQLAELREQTVLDGAAVVLDTATGEVLAYVGSANYRSLNSNVDMAAAPRQAGSTLKPLLYGQAFAEGLITPNTLLADTPFSDAQASGLYRPQNYNAKYQGLVPASMALAGSLNIPAVRVLDMLGNHRFMQQLLALGFNLDAKEAETYGLGLALGAVEVNLLSLTNAYRALANEGRYSPVRWQSGAVSSEQTALKPAAAQQINAILADRSSRAITFGFDSVLATRYPASVKTGTSKAMRDNWCIGYSKHYTVGVWVGNASGAPMRAVSGVTGAAPAWAQMFDALHAKLPSPAASSLTFSSEAVAAQQSAIRIISPTRDATYALDPDTPVNKQRISLHAEGKLPTSARWWLNQQALATTERSIALPSPGWHSLSLRSGETVLDELRFRVARPK